MVHDLRTGKLPVFCKFPGLADTAEADIHGWPIPPDTTTITDTYASATWPETSSWQVVSDKTFGLEGLNKYFLHPLEVTAYVSLNWSTDSSDFLYYPDLLFASTWEDFCADVEEDYENPSYSYSENFAFRGELIGDTFDSQFHSHAVHPLQRYACAYRWSGAERPWARPSALLEGDSGFDLRVTYSLCSDTGIKDDGLLNGPFDITKYRMVLSADVLGYGRVPCESFSDYIGQQTFFTYPVGAPIQAEWTDGDNWLSGSRTTLNFMGLNFPAAKSYRSIMGETGDPAHVYAKRTSQSISLSFSTDFAAPIANQASDIAANEGGAGFNNAPLILI